MEKVCRHNTTPQIERDPEMKTTKAPNGFFAFFSRIFSSSRPLPKTSKVIRPNAVEYDIEIVVTVSNPDIDAKKLRKIIFESQKTFFPNGKSYKLIYDFRPRSYPAELFLEGKTQEFYRVNDSVLLADGVTFEVARFGKKMVS